MTSTGKGFSEEKGPIPPPGGAFTFLEVLVALTVLAIVACALLAGHGLALRAEREARGAEEARFVLERARTDLELGALVSGVKTAYGPWRVEVTDIEAASATQAAWRQIAVYRGDETGAVTQCHARPLRDKREDRQVPAPPVQPRSSPRYPGQ